jgi:hypothetical protein
MATLADHFDKVTYKPKFFLGDRVYGKQGKIPWVGTVMIDTLINHEEGSFVSVWLDLPIKVGGEYKDRLKIMKGRGIKYLTAMVEDEKKLQKNLKNTKTADTIRINKSKKTRANAQRKDLQ